MTKVSNYPTYKCTLITGTLVTIASATDEDADENALITYSIPDNDLLPFDIDPFTGEVRLG